MNIQESNHIIITDIGSTTTKMLLLEKSGNQWCFRSQINVPTTVEKPDEDVKIGFLAAVRHLQQELDLPLLGQDGTPCVPCLATSSAGGGLQILVFGLAIQDTGKAAEMTANGAGGVILRTFTIDDRIPAAEKMRMIRDLHPDLILMAGGLDGGNIASVIRQAEILSLADPEPKFVQNEKIPLVFCGNIDARKFVMTVLEQNFDVHIVDNIRPVNRVMNTGPAKEKIHQLFMENVMERAPGYAELKPWMTSDILPTPAGMEKILRLYGNKSAGNVVAVDMGGATTDIFSNINGQYHRTVAANIGMSYSISNILASTGIESLMRHLPDNFSDDDVRDYISNKMLNPVYVPSHVSEILIEQAAAIEGIQLAWRQHLEMNFDTENYSIFEKFRLPKHTDTHQQMFRSRDMSHMFQVSDIDILIGAGGVISFIESHEQAIRILTDAFRPAGITRLAIDKNFKSPHMGVLSTVDPELAFNLFTSECLQEIGTVIAPTGKIQSGQDVLTVTDKNANKDTVIRGGELLYLPAGGDYDIKPARNIRIHSDKNSIPISTTLPILIDCRGREKYFSGQSLAHSIPEFRLPETAFSTSIRHQTPEIYTGSFECRRKLPYEGDIFVKKGDQVSPGTVVGENRFAPPVIYIIDLQGLIGYDTPLTPEIVEAGLQIKVGDAINSGDCIFKTVSGMFGGKTNWYSPVRGRIINIEPNGLIVLREIQDYSLEPVTIDIAQKLSIKPSHIKGYLCVSKGSFVQKGQALTKTSREKPMLTSSTTGMVRDIDTTNGTITIQYILNPVQLNAFVQGTVTKIQDNYSATIEGRGVILTGIIGFGRETSGTLQVVSGLADIDSGVKDRVIAIREPVDAQFLTQCAKAGIRGAVIPSIRNSEWVAFSSKEIGVALTGDETIPLTVIITEGFGLDQMNERYFETLKTMETRVISLRGRTQIRAGVTRPVVFLAD
jgi:uncharacterized protein (TIGR01319 family)